MFPEPAGLTSIERERETDKTFYFIHKHEVYIYEIWFEITIETYIIVTSNESIALNG